MRDIHAIFAESVMLQLKLSELVEKLAHLNVRELQSLTTAQWFHGHSMSSSYLEGKRQREVETERLQREIMAARERLQEILAELGDLPVEAPVGTS